MSSAGSSTVGNMPPRHGKKLADVMEEAFKNNSKPISQSDTDKSPGGAQPEAPAPSRKVETGSAPAKAPVARKIEGYTFQIASVYPPQPCERCVRSKKTCRGVEGARCEHCKTLHQKCSNSTGPPRGRHAAVRQNSNPPNAENSAGPSTEPTRAKRKPTSKAKQNSVDEDSEDAGPALKKRRVAGDARANTIKDVAELEGAIKKIQTSVNKDLKHLAQLAASLSAQLQEAEN